MQNKKNTIQQLACLDPNYQIFVNELPSEFSNVDVDLSPGLQDDLIALLKVEQPDLFLWLNIQKTDVVDYTFANPFIAAGLLAAILFLLRSHIKIKRTSTGKWSFSFEHEPADNELMKKVLDALQDILKNYTS